MKCEQNMNFVDKVVNFIDILLIFVDIWLLFVDMLLIFVDTLLLFVDMLLTFINIWHKSLTFGRITYSLRYFFITHKYLRLFHNLFM
ncbi:hypothetical protein CN601_19630 [Bacillus sp. AFS017336]|nr:hypothetical protein CN601_19630 [Bacillus sp. AFS017336]